MIYPLISIIVPVYNVNKYLHECINSIINQTYTNIEIILIDDGSTDGSDKICNFYQKNYDKIRVYHQINSGLSAARNAGLKLANGEYVYFIDSDDWIENYTIDYLYNSLINSNSDISCGSLNLYYEKNSKKNKPIISNLGIIDKKIAIKELCTNSSNINLTIACNKLYKISLFDNLLFEEGKINEDAFIIYKLYSKCNRIIFINNPNYFYRQRNTSIMNSETNEIAKLDGLEAYYNLYIFLQENKMNDCIKPFLKTFIKCYCQRVSHLNSLDEKTNRFIYIKNLCDSIYKKNEKSISIKYKFMYNFPKTYSKIKNMIDLF